MSNHKEKFDNIHYQNEEFKKFYNNVKEIFAKLRDNDNKAAILQQRCMLQVCPGSRAGGNNPDVVEVFWGAQSIKRIDRKDRFKILIETGVTMLFNLLPDGHVMISLYPAANEIMKPIEDSILLHRFCYAEWLNKPKNQEHLWKDFMAYTECTSLIGTPSVRQRLRVWWIKYSRPYYIEGKQQPITMFTHAISVMKYILTVGLSGFLLWILQTCASSEKESNYSSNISAPISTKINEIQNNVEGKIDATIQNTADINAKLDGAIKVIIVADSTKQSTKSQVAPKDPCVKTVKLNVCNDTIVPKDVLK